MTSIYGRFRRALTPTLVALALVAVPASTRADDPPTYAWTGEPAWIANHGVYRSGEFIYQDYVYDDHGANTDGINRRDNVFGLWPDPQRPTDQRWSPTGGSIRYSGDFMYPADGDHIANIADLIEFRVAADDDNVYYHVRLGDMSAPDSSVVALCVDTDRNATSGVQAWPLGAGLVSRLGCDFIITAWGTGATITTPDGDQDLIDAGGAVVADVDEATIDLAVPRAAADPGEGTWRYYVASGMWDGDGWLQVVPGPQVIGAPVATGGGIGVPQIWDLLSNNSEPNSYWMEEKQSNDLVRHFILDDFVDVDFARLALAVDDPDPETTGFVPRIYRSAHPMTPARGLEIDRGTSTNFIYNGPYQPYAMVVPSNYYDEPRRAFPFDLCMHPLNGNHMVEVYYAEAFNQREGYNPLVTGTLPQTGYLGFSQIEGLVDRLGTLYACVLGRGEGVGYTGGRGLVDVLEVQADVMARYDVDLDRVTAHGVSLGAIGTWYLTPLYPDRYAAGMPYIFSPAIVNSDFPRLENLYNVPMYYAIGTLDQFAQGTQGDPTADALEALGNEYLYVHYLGRQHEGRIEQDFLPFTEHLAYPRERVRDPARVRFTFDPGAYPEEIPGDGSAYWVSGMVPRAEAPASIDAVSLARADRLPPAQVVIDGLYTNTIEGWQARIRGLFRMTEEEFRAMWHPEAWEPGWVELSLDITETALPAEEVGNAFRVDATNLGAVTLDTDGMDLDVGAPIEATLSGDGTTTLTLAGPWGAVPPVTLDGDAVPAAMSAEGLVIELDLAAGPHTLVIG